VAWDLGLLSFTPTGLGLVFAYLRCQFAGGGAGDVLPGFYLVQAIGYMSLALLIGQAPGAESGLFWAAGIRVGAGAHPHPPRPIAWTSFFPMKAFGSLDTFPSGRCWKC